MKKLIPLFIAVLLLTSCLPGDFQLPQSPLLKALERKSGLIAYVGADGNIYVSDQAGGNKIAFTEDAEATETSGSFLYYQYPTWSADSNHLAFVGISGTGTSPTGTSLHIGDIDEKKAEQVFSSKNENPFYLYWSPNDETLSYLSTTASGQSIMLQSIPVEGGERTILDTGSPYYWSWAPDGSSMIVHTGGGTSSVPVHLSFLQMGSDIVEQQLDTIPASFQAPAWSPNGAHILLSRINDKEEKEIILTDPHGKFEKAIGTFDIATAFVWSRDSELVAYIDVTTQTTLGVLGNLHVLDLTNSEDFFQDDNVMAAFWSPNSKKLAYFKPVLVDPATGEVATAETTSPYLVLIMYVLDVNSGESKELFQFRPTNQFANVLPYFDQYHQSVTIWSPDSNNLVLSFLTQEGAPGIAIAAASGQLEPRLLDQGYIAFWSWE